MNIICNKLGHDYGFFGIARRCITCGELRDETPEELAARLTNEYGEQIRQTVANLAAKVKEDGKRVSLRKAMARRRKPYLGR